MTLLDDYFNDFQFPMHFLPLQNDEHYSNIKKNLAYPLSTSASKSRSETAYFLYRVRQIEGDFVSSGKWCRVLSANWVFCYDSVICN